MKKITLKLIALSLSLCLIMLFCSCGAKYAEDADANLYNKSDKMRDVAFESEDWGYADSEAEVPEEMPSPDDGSKQSDGATSDLGSRKLIKNVYMSIQTKKYDDFVSSLKAMITESGGYVQSSEMYDDGNRYSSRRADFEVRIPAEKLDMFVDGVKGEATVTHYNEKLEDVTIQYVDIESRISSLRAERDKLNELLISADNLDQVILLQDKIEYLTYQIESYESKIRTLSELISYSTVKITICEVEREEIVEKQGTWEEIGSNLSENFSDVGEGFRRFFIGTVSDIPYLLVTLLVLAIVAVVVIIVVKIIKKKHGKR